MRRATPILFGLLFAASVSAFFVAQRIKNSPSTIQRLLHPRTISPNGDHNKDTIGFTLRLKKSDRVTLTLLDRNGEPVRTLVEDRALRAYRVLRGVRWDGRDKDGHVVPDGLYRLRITLRDQGISVIDTKSITVDTKPPKPTIAGVSGHYTATFKKARGRGASITVFQTSPKVRKVISAPLPAGATTFTWDGNEQSGGRAPAGTYVFVARWSDKAGNFGTSIPLGPNGLPDAAGSYPGKGGITISYVSVTAPAAAVKAGQRAAFGIDTHGVKYRWALRRAGGRTIKSGRADRSVLNLQIPRAKAGLYVLDVTAGNHRSRAPFVVNGTSSQGGSGDVVRGVLVVVPAMTWQGRNAVDDDGDGAPNLLDRGARSAAVLDAAGRMRAFEGDGLPVGFTTHEQPLFHWLDNGHSYDVATDIELQREPRLLSRYRGVVLAGDTRWLTAEQRARLRRFVQGGGKLLSLGVDSLRRTVRLTNGGVMTDPSAAAQHDLFGAAIGRVQSAPTNLAVFGSDDLGLFSRMTGAIAGVKSWEPTSSVGPDAEKMASAVTIDGIAVTVLVRYGDGLVIRPGFGDFSARLGETDVDGLMDGAWALLSR